MKNFLPLAALIAAFLFTCLLSTAQTPDTCWAICHQYTSGPIRCGQGMSQANAKSWESYIGEDSWIQNICDSVLVAPPKKPRLQIPKIGTPRKSIYDKPNDILVFQQEYAVAQAQDTNYTIETIGAGPCIVVAFWDSVSHVGGLVHLAAMVLHASSEFEMLGRPWVQQIEQSMIKAGFHGNASTVQVHIIGGQTGMSDNLYAHIDTTLRQAGFSNVVEIDYGGDFEMRRNILLNTRNGQVYDLYNILPLDTKEERTSRFQLRILQALMPEVNYTGDTRAKPEYEK